MDTTAITKLDDTQVCKESMIDEKNLSWQWMIIQPSGDVGTISLRPVPDVYTGLYISIASMSGMADGHILSGRLYTVSSHVPYSYGAATGEVVLQSFLADI
jgi:hypothetical protein